MSPLFQKLNWKGQVPVWVLDAPGSFASELSALGDVPLVTAEPSRTEAVPMPFLLAFVTDRERVAQVAQLVARYTTRDSDSVLWLAYPKLASRRYAGELSRDRGWEALRAAGFDTVRQVAIDEDWSALRFRHAGFIGSRAR